MICQVLLYLIYFTGCHFAGFVIMITFAAFSILFSHCRSDNYVMKWVGPTNCLVGFGSPALGKQLSFQLFAGFLLRYGIS